jgi:hypothetical protein
MFLPDEPLSEATSWPVLTVRACLRGLAWSHPDRPSNLSFSPVYRAAPAIRMTDEPISLTPQQIAELKRQLQAANARLLAVERRRQELRAYIATLAAQLKRAESYRSPDQS